MALSVRNVVFLPFYYAKDTKIFDKHGLNVELIQMRSDLQLAGLASGEIDLIVERLYRPVVPDGFVREPLWTETISILARAGHELFKQDHVTVEATNLSYRP